MTSFDPLKIVQDSVASGFDPSVADELDERDMDWAPNVVRWAMDPQFLDAKTIFPHQLQVALRLFGDACPTCSDWDFYQQEWMPDLKVPNILDRLQLFEHGVCPKCKGTRLDAYREKKWNFPNELALLWGMRCLPRNALVFTDRGLLPLEDVRVGDELSHGMVSEVFDSGTPSSLIATTDHNWEITGARDTHIVPVLDENFELRHQYLKDCKIGDVAVLYSPDLWATEPAGMTPEAACLLGLGRECVETDSLPSCILRSPKEIVLNFLVGLFGGNLVNFTTPSRTIAKQVRLLLLNMGILTDLEESTAGYTVIFRPLPEIIVPTPVGDFRVGASDFPPKLRALLDAGYHFVRIRQIREGEPVPMMDVSVPGSNVFTADGFVHHNSGKSAVAGIIGSYALHLFLRIREPGPYFEIFKGSELCMRFVAITAQQSKETGWMQFCRAVHNSSWFPRYHDFLKPYSKKKGVELVRWLHEKFEYNHKGIFGYPFGASIDTSRGRTAIWTMFDEIGWWMGRENAIRANPSETYAAYRAASQTIQNLALDRFLKGDLMVPTAYMVSVSSTCSKADFIMRLVKQGKTDRRMVVSHKATWEVNPAFLNVEVREAERIRDPRNFQRNFASIPPFAEEPFIDSAETVLRSAVLPRPRWGVEVKTNRVGTYLSAEHQEGSKNIPYCLAMDLGFNNCGYAAALLKLKEDDFGVVQVAGLWSMYPVSEIAGGQNRVIDIDATYKEFIEKLCEKLNIRMVLFDQWQSKQQIQALQKLNIKAQQYSLTYRDFVTFRSQLLQGKLENVQPEIPIADVEASTKSLETLLYPNPYLHVLWQTLSVQEFGNKITKGDGHDDLFRCLVLGTRFLWDDDIRRLFEYRAGIATSGQKSRFVASGGSRSGQMYGANPSGQGGSTVLANRKVMGGIIPRSRKF